MRRDDSITIEGIRPTNAGGWAVVGSKPGESVVPGRSPRVIVLLQEFTGLGAQAKARAAAGTDRIIPVGTPATVISRERNELIIAEVGA